MHYRQALHFMEMMYSQGFPFDTVSEMAQKQFGVSKAITRIIWENAY